jgi:hypothetical protein
LRYADAVGRIFPIRFRVLHCILLQPHRREMPDGGPLFGAVS